MKRFLTLLVLVCFLVGTTSAQTLMTYGPYKVEAKEFMRAYKRNNTDTVSPKAQSMRQYLDLYANARLKIKEAYLRRYDTLPGIVLEVENLRTQLIDKYLADPVLLERLKKEAFERSQTDRDVVHIFIAFRNPNRELDSARATQRKAEVEKRLQQGADFTALAREFSDDPAVNQNQGRIGFVTAFTLPYDMESAIYQTAIGSNSGWVRSNIGYHIFRVLSDRPALGTFKAKQILFAIPPGADENEKKRIQQLADSVYMALKNGAGFGEMARLYSNDYISAANGGELMEFGIGQYDPAFETKLITLKQDGELTTPFFTKHGWHILQRVKFTPPTNDWRKLETQQQYDQKVRSDDRWRNAKDFIYELVQKKVGYRRAAYTESALWQYSDSLLDLKSMTVLGKTIQKSTPLSRSEKIWVRKYIPLLTGSSLRPIFVISLMEVA